MEPFYRREEMGAERPLALLFRQLSHDLGSLLRQEAELARAEIRAKGKKVYGAAGFLGAGVLVSLSGFLGLMFAAVLAVSMVIGSLLIGAVVVGVIALLAGLALLAYGRSQLNATELKPVRTIESLRKDADLASDSLTPGKGH